MTTDTSTYLDLPLDQLHDSPTNPRQVYDDASLQELATDIKAHGRVLQALLVRPHVPELFRGTDDPNAQAGYEIVFGHRRRRAAELAGLATVRCEVRSMTDLEVQRAQISENLARRDVHPFEEAAGYQALIQQHGETADTIAASTGKSRSYIYGRLKLLAVVPEVRDACLQGKVGTEVALLIARLRHPKLQASALKKIHARNQQITDGGAQSFRRIRELLLEEFTTSLKGAPFPTEDPTLLKGATACQDCPKLSGNAPEYADLAEGREAWHGRFERGLPDVCTDPDCFAAKKAAHFRRQADELRDRGHNVIEGARARASLDANDRVRGAYIELAKVQAEVKKAKGKHLITEVLIQSPRTGKTTKAVAVADLKAAGLMKADAPDPGSKASHQEQVKQAQQQREEQEAAEQAALDARLARLRATLASTRRTANELRVLVLALLAVDNDTEALAKLWNVPNDLHSAWQARLAEMTKDQVALLLFDVTMHLAKCLDVRMWDHDTGLLSDLEYLHGLDAEPASTPAAAARAQDGGADDQAPAADASAASGGTEAPGCRVISAAAWPFPGQRARGESQTDEAGSAGQEQTDDAGVAAGGSGAEVAA